ncbi:hypothetical protein [Streptomyces scopuliridis]|uniref:hypothetical protein n=1 Tax=Streptomyces scopuliridis TaxID=452529 RepID=UPI003693A9B5
MTHVLGIFEDSPDEMPVIAATTGIYPEAPWTGLRMGDLRRLLGDHAHALAEQIRGNEWEDCGSGDTNCPCDAADLIDPEATP